GDGEWISVYRPAAFGRHEEECPFQLALRHSLASVISVNEEACSSPVRRRDAHIAITPHPTREFDKASELTPPNDISPVVDEGCVGPVRSDELLLVFLVLS